MVTVLIADDHPIVRRGLRATLADDASLTLVGEAETGEQALVKIAALAPAVAILDIEMPGMSGIAIARELLKTAGNMTRIIFMTFHADEDLMRAAMDAGGRGYLLKGSDTEEICDAVHAVCLGRTFIGSKMADILCKNAVPPSGTAGLALGVLTPTEQSVLRLISDGLSSKEVAEHLRISHRTVENHRTNMCRKFGIEGTNALSRFALQHRTALHQRLS